jgi:hypothetical protein
MELQYIQRAQHLAEMYSLLNVDREFESLKIVQRCTDALPVIYILQIH